MPLTSRFVYWHKIAVSPAGFLEVATNLCLKPSSDHMSALLNVMSTGAFQLASPSLNDLLLNFYKEVGPRPRNFTNTISNLTTMFPHRTSEAVKAQRSCDLPKSTHKIK